MRTNIDDIVMLISMMFLWTLLTISHLVSAFRYLATHLQIELLLIRKLTKMILLHYRVGIISHEYRHVGNLVLIVMDCSNRVVTISQLLTLIVNFLIIYLLVVRVLNTNLALAHNIILVLLIHKVIRIHHVICYWLVILVHVDQLDWIIVSLTA